MIATNTEKVIFDMDGLIFDSERMFMNELAAAAKDYGYTVTLENYIPTMGLAGEALVALKKRIYGEDYPHFEISRRARERMDGLALSGKLTIKPGIRELLEFLKENDIPCAVASSTQSRFVEKYLTAAGLRGYFKTVIGGDMIEHSKPEPDIFLCAAGDTPPERCLVLEDSPNGVTAAHRAGIPVICIPDMVYPPEEVKRLAAAVVDSAHDVTAILEKHSVLGNLKPERVMKHFAQICAIPHGSRDTDRIAQYCTDFAAAHGLWYRRDTSNNVIIKKPAQNSASKRTVMLQGHLDMVCAKNDGAEIDFARDGLNIKQDGKYIYADGTTLGGDDGIAVAMALAVLEDGDISHPALECVFTTDEEIGMLGAAALDTDGLCADCLLNIDSEDEGVFTVSCAGGATLSAVFRGEKSERKYRSAMKITVGGLIGGHSGVEIDKGRANACIVLGRVLSAVSDVTDIAVISIEGGEKDNAIARRAEAVIAADDTGAVKKEIAVQDKLFKAKYSLTDADIKITAEKTEPAAAPLECGIIPALSAVPNGVRAMSADIDGLVKTSLNLGVLRTDGENITAVFSIRSSDTAEKSALVKEVSDICAGCGAEINISGDYPAWEYKKKSDLRDACAAVYAEQYGTAPVITAIHAGLECGIFSAKLPGIDCVSFGPNILDIHTPNERLDTESTRRVYKFLLTLLERL